MNALISVPNNNGNDTFTFDFHGSPVRGVVRSGEPWFVATDVCRALGFNEKLRGGFDT